MDEKSVHKAINIILADRKAYDTSLNWAINDCLQSVGLHGDDLNTQCLYILNNITRWRNPEAKNVRNILKAFTSNK